MEGVVMLSKVRKKGKEINFNKKKEEVKGKTKNI